MAKQHQATKKTRRAREHNDTVGRLERLAVPVGERSDPPEVGYLTSDPTYRPLFEAGNQVWLDMERLELPDKARYQGCPVVHVPIPKPVRDDNRRSTAELVEGLGEDDRFEFNEGLQPEDSWEPEAGDDVYVVEAILDNRWSISTGTERTQR
ncbi:unnamed protein product [Phytophthora fragariaefolia]|uniref:Unnamed protein product n=1 Tax=Phytophthora fragariaefolia TaxID=1490495 RepID=A0A9W6TRS2_9STRA|nr:unnamed protein product [Phytophthora fragariaefolia]